MSLSILPRVRHTSNHRSEENSARQVIKSQSVPRFSNSRSQIFENQQQVNTTHTSTVQKQDLSSAADRNSGVMQETEQIIIQKKLPKLYTAELYNSFYQKTNNIKDKYMQLYKQVQKEGENQPRLRTLRDVIKETEDAFSRSYSIKYFGANQDQVGVLSRRVPIKFETRTKYLISNRDNLNSQNETISIGYELDHQKRDNLDFQRKLGNETARSIGSDYFGNGTQRNQQYNEENSSSKFYTKAREDLENSKQISSILNENQNAYIVNKYFIPKELHTVKNKHKRSRSIEPLEGRLNFELNSKKVVGAKNAGASSSLERASKGVDKIKRTMLRGQLATTKNINEPTRDMILETDRYMTQEMKNLLAERNNLSYAKLLSSIQNPETLEKYPDRRLLEQPPVPRKNQKIEKVPKSPKTGPKSPKNEHKNPNESSKTLPVRESTLRPVQNNTMYNSYLKIANKYGEGIKSLQDLQNRPVMNTTTDALHAYIDK